MKPPTVKDQLEALILDALKTRYIAESCLDGTPTGNAYQSVTLGPLQTAGFRTYRGEVLDAIPFRGKKVLDLGSNLGELSRAARARGAELVDGFEYDPYFIEIANLANAYNDVSRVSFHRRDITDPAVYTEHYDVVLAFSVFTYIDKVLAEIAAHTRELLILETHRLRDNLDSLYLRTVTPHFPHHRVLTTTEWGTNKAEDEVRAVVAFAHSPAALDRIPLLREQGGPIPAPEASGLLDLQRSRLAFLDAFFNKYHDIVLRGLDATLQEVDRVDSADSAFRHHADYANGPAGWLYWAIFLKGYLHYHRRGEVVPDNPYVVYLHRYFEDTRFDPAFGSIIADEDRLLRRTLLRFEVIDRLRRAPEAAIDPVCFYDTEQRSPEFTLYEVASDKPFSCSHLDGYHRIFCARLFDVRDIPFVVSSRDPHARA